MTIPAINPTGRPSSLAPREINRSGPDGFGAAMRQASMAASAAGIPAQAEIGALLALQEDPPSHRGDPAARRTAVTRAAKNVLSVLAGLQVSLTGGMDAANPLEERLAAALRDLPTPQNPEEGALLEAVILRGRLELERRRAAKASVTKE